MRWLALFAVSLAACAVFVPDYNANRLIWTPPTPGVLVDLVPFGPVCATERDRDGKRYRPATVVVNVVELGPQPATIVIDETRSVTFEPDTSFMVDFKAGIGPHIVETDVGGHRSTRVLLVYRCDD